MYKHKYFQSLVQSCWCSNITLLHADDEAEQTGSESRGGSPEDISDPISDPSNDSFIDDDAEDVEGLADADAQPDLRARSPTAIGESALACIQHQ